MTNFLLISIVLTLFVLSAGAANLRLQDSGDVGIAQGEASLPRINEDEAVRIQWANSGNTQSRDLPRPKDKKKAHAAVQQRLTACQAALSSASATFNPSQSPCTGLYGRIVRLRPPMTAVECLSKDPERLKVVFVMGDDGLGKMIGKAGLERLMAIGVTADYIREALANKSTFKLVIFSSFNGEKPPLATWETLVEVASELYPADGGKLYNQLEGLQSTPFKEIQRKTGLNFFSVLGGGPTGEHYITPKKLATKLEGTLAEVRLFLYLYMDANELYAGDGWTRDEAGNRGVREYLMPDRLLKEMNGQYRVLDMLVEL